MTRILNLLYVTLAAAALAACTSGGVRAPVSDVGHRAAVPTATHEERFAQSEKDWRPQTYVVQKGDTLYGIAFNYGLDYHEVAELNNIQDPRVIKVGQEIRLFPQSAAAAKPAAAASKPLGIPVKDQPRAIKLPYSEQALAEVQKMQEASHKPEPAVAKTELKTEPESKVEAPAEAAVADNALEWSMPSKGKVVGEFSESANRKGIDIAGKLGQPVMASAAGKVVYSGSGLRGYGKLVIIKHNSTYLSAYAHNSQVLVKEGQAVTRGQKIAEMGSTDADRVELHFEIRKLGKPVDPAKYLPPIKP